VLEVQYIEAVRVCQTVEKDYDQKAAELLKRFENLEVARVQMSCERLSEFFTLWQQVWMRGGEGRGGVRGTERETRKGSWGEAGVDLCLFFLSSPHRTRSRWRTC
jgi:hypothetical protein